MNILFQSYLILSTVTLRNTYSVCPVHIYNLKKTLIIVTKIASDHQILMTLKQRHLGNVKVRTYYYSTSS